MKSEQPDHLLCVTASDPGHAVTSRSFSEAASKKVLQFQIMDDNPALSELRLSWASAVYTGEDGIGQMGSLHEAGDSLVAVGRLEDEGIKFIGSGVMVGPGLVVTASHVLEEFPRTGAGPIFVTFLPDGSRAWLPRDRCTAVGPSEFDDERSRISDLTLVSCTLSSKAHEDRPLCLASIKAEVPLLGSRLWAFGYRQESLDDSIPGITPYVSSGKVTALFAHGRGERMPASCIEVDMESFGGMSGGAVVNADGDLIGIVSSSFEGGPTYVTLIWDVLRLTVESKLPYFSGRGPIGLFDAEMAGLVRINGQVKRRGRDVVLDMSEEESAVFAQSLSPAQLEAGKLAGTRRIENEDEFFEKWSDEIEEFTTRSALSYLLTLPVETVAQIMGASGIAVERLNDAIDFSVEDFEGMGSREFLSAEQIDPRLVEIRLDFNLSTIIWAIRIPEKSYIGGAEYFDEHFINIEVAEGLASLKFVQKLGFEALVSLDLVEHEVTGCEFLRLFLRERRRRK